MFVRQEISFIYNNLTGLLHGPRYEREGNYRTKYHGFFGFEGYAYAAKEWNSLNVSSYTIHFITRLCSSFGIRFGICGILFYVGPRSGSLKREAYADWSRDFRF